MKVKQTQESIVNTKNSPLPSYCIFQNVKMVRNVIDGKSIQTSDKCKFVNNCIKLNSSEQL